MNTLRSYKDIDGDGRDDLAMSDVSYAVSDYKYKKDALYVFSGKDLKGNIDTSKALMKINPNSGSIPSCFGWKIVLIDDVDSDGRKDLMVSNPCLSTGGEVYIFSMKNLTNSNVSSALTKLRGGTLTTDDMFGYSIADAGDVNGDKVGDILIGAPGKDRSATNPSTALGAVYVYDGAKLGNKNILEKGKLISLISPTDSNMMLGKSVYSAGDINSDGYADILAGGPDGARRDGIVYLFSGGYIRDKIDIKFNWAKPPQGLVLQSILTPNNDVSVYQYSGEVILADSMGHLLITEIGKVNLYKYDNGSYQYSKTLVDPEGYWTFFSY